MQLLYNTFIVFAERIVPIFGLFKPKIKQFVQGRKQTFDKLQKSIAPEDTTIWMHCASLGEFEQGRPVIEKIKQQFTEYKIIISFFSPSGYEIQKDYPLADTVVYLPFDTPKKIRKFIHLTHPTLAIIVKYEFWPNLLKELKHQKIKTLLISGIFRKNQRFFKSNNIWYRNTLQSFSHFFVQNRDSVSLLKKIGYTNVTESGDTRFDRVLEILKTKKKLAFLDDFSKNYHVLVAGSTWPKDEKLLVKYCNQKAKENERFIFAPHNIESEEIKRLQNSLNKRTVLYSQANSQNIKNAKVLIIDSIGILTQVYAYADLAYVGGGFGVGIHNILEPATYGIPILIGPNYQKFQEARDLILEKACFEVDSYSQLEKLLEKMIENPTFRIKSGKIAAAYIQKNSGASKKIMEYVTKVL